MLEVPHMIKIIVIMTICYSIGNFFYLFYVPLLVSSLHSSIQFVFYNWCKCCYNQPIAHCTLYWWVSIQHWAHYNVHRAIQSIPHNVRDQSTLCVSMVHSSVLSIASDPNCISAVLMCWDLRLVWRWDSCQPVYLCQYFCPSSIWLGGGSRSSQSVTVLGDAAYNTWRT